MSVGLGTNWTPFIHYLDYINMVPYRYDKLFCGYIQNEENSREKVIWNYSVPVRKVNAEGNGIKLGKLAEYEGFWRQDQIGRGLINTISYKEYFDFALDLSKNLNWLTATGPPIKTEVKRPTKILQSSPGFNQNNCSAPILGRDTRPLVGDNLEDIYIELRRNLLGATIDLLAFHTGSNLGGYVIPEAWTPLCLEIKSSDQDIFAIYDQYTLKHMVHEYSRSVAYEEQVFQDMSLFNHEDYALTPYLLCIEPVFALKLAYKEWFIQNFKHHSPLSLSFKAELHKSMASFVVLKTTYAPKRISQAIIIDTLNLQPCDLDMNLLAQYLKEGFDIVIGPRKYAYHYADIYLKSTNIFSIGQQSLGKLSMSRGPNLSDNKSVNKIETSRIA